jgi:serine/alanine adding enzyme
MARHEASVRARTVTGRTVIAGSEVTLSEAGENESDAWDAFVSSSVDATGYHAWGWRGVFKRAFGHEPVYLVARRGPIIEGVLPLVQVNSPLFGRSLTSLPFLNYGGVVASEDDVAEALVGAATTVAHARRCDYVELRHVARRFPGLPSKQHKVTMLLPVAEARWDCLDRKVRNQIRKAQKSGLTAQFGGIELLDDFYAVFARNMRDLGTPVHSRRFFEEVLDTFREQCGVHVVRLLNRPVAAAVTYRTGAVAMMPWASSIRTYNALCPNHLLYWDVIERATAYGCETIDFGRSTPGEGTYHFKEQWGARPVPLHWEYSLLSARSLPDASPANGRFAVFIEAWKRLPLLVANRFGPPIVRVIP